MRLLQSKESEAFTDRVTDPNGVSIKSRLWAGRTIDLTLFAVVRAADVIVGELWARRKAWKLALNRWHKSDDMIAYFTDPALFAASCSLVMVRTFHTLFWQKPTPFGCANLPVNSRGLCQLLFFLKKSFPHANYDISGLGYTFRKSFPRHTTNGSPVPLKLIRDSLKL